MRSFQLVLKDQWGFIDESVVLSWTPEIKSDLTWSDTRHLLVGVSCRRPARSALLVRHIGSRLGANFLYCFVSGR